MEKTVIAYRIRAEGIFGRKRNRSVQSTTFEYSDVDGTFTQVKFEAALADMAATLKPKPGTTWRLLAVPVTENRYADPSEPTGEVIYHMEAIFNVGIRVLAEGEF